MPTPILTFESDNGLELIDGHRRMAAAAAAGAEAPVLVYPAATPRPTIASLALQQNGGSLSVGEKLIAIYRTAAFLVGDTPSALPVREASLPPVPDALLDAYSNLAQRAVSVRLIERLLQTVTWPEEQLQAVHDKMGALEHVLPLLDLSVQERRAFFALAAQTRLSAAESKRIARLFLFARGHKAVDLEDWVESMSRNTATGRDAIASLTAALRPGLSGRAERVEALVKRMKLPTGVKITAPEYLEGDSFSCYFRFSQIEQFESYVRVLGAAAESGVVSEMLDALNHPEEDAEDTE